MAMAGASSSSRLQFCNVGGNVSHSEGWQTLMEMGAETIGMSCLIGESVVSRVCAEEDLGASVWGRTTEGLEWS